MKEKAKTMKKKKVDCPHTCFRTEDGFNAQLMITAAHRYCLGRKSYIVGACQDWLRDSWLKFNLHTKTVILRDTIEYLMDCEEDAFDVADWRSFAEWGWEQLNTIDQTQISQALSHKRKPWPLYKKEVETTNPIKDASRSSFNKNFELREILEDAWMFVPPKAKTETFQRLRQYDERRKHVADFIETAYDNDTDLCWRRESAEKPDENSKRVP